MLRQKERRAEITQEEGRQALTLLERLQIRFIWDWSLLQRAFSLAEELNQPTVYDTAYLALAIRYKCDLWTADSRFARAGQGRYPFIRLLDYSVRE